MPQVSLAQPSTADTERARRLFQQGVRFIDRGDWERAAERFREAQTLRDAPAIRLNLAAALIELGEYQEAGELLETVREDPETNEDLQALNTETMQDLDSRTVRIALPEDRAEGEQVLVNGEPVNGDTAWAGPGVHRVELQRDGQTIAQTEVAGNAGGRGTAVLTEEEPTADDPPVPREVVPPRDEGWWHEPVPWIVAGGVVATILIVGIVAAVLNDGGGGGGTFGAVQQNLPTPGGHNPESRPRGLLSF
ncbi:MAG: tetratricopeptide repeat protein [Myxococcota bacterium]